MKKLSAIIILSSLLLASCSINNPLKKKAPAPTADTAMEKTETTDAMTAPSEVDAMEEKTPEDTMMKAKVEVDAAMQ